MKDILFFLFVASVLFLIDLYAFQALKTVFPFETRVGKISSFIYWGITTFIVLAIIATAIFGMQSIPSVFRKLFAGLFFLGMITKTFAIIWLFGEDIYRFLDAIFQKLFSKTTDVSIASRRKFLSQMALFSALVPLMVLTYGVVRNAYNYKFHKIKLSLKRLPSNFKGFKIVQLSDIHAGSFTQKSPIEKAIEKINALEPDLIVFTGDLVNDLASEMDDYKEVFSKLKAKHGVLSVLGNHDYGIYAFGRENSPEKEANFRDFLQVHEDMGWLLLRNEHKKITVGDQSIDLIGVENFSSNGRFASYGDLSKASNGLDKNSFKILMSHDPSHWDHEVNKTYKDIDLTLSGHTHGFQFGIETKWLKWSPSQYVYKQWAGLYQTGEQFLYVNRGFGNLGYPGRVGILPEVSVIELS